jgi:hypothetical protein
MVIHGDLGISIETTQGIRNARNASLQPDDWWPPQIHDPNGTQRVFRGYTLWLFNISMDWFKGKSTGNHGFYRQIDRAFRIIFPSSNSMNIAMENHHV